MKKINKFFLLIVTILCATILPSCVNDDEPSGSTIQLHDKLPQFSVTLTNGVTIDTQSLYGKCGLILFFNTNCQDCQKELPVVQQVWNKYKDNDEIEIILISREESSEEIEAYWDAHDLSMPYSPQENRDIYSLFAKSIIPRIYIFDKDFTVVFMSGDEDLPSQSLLENRIEALKNS